jgi:hypothetical protein
MIEVPRFRGGRWTLVAPLVLALVGTAALVAGAALAPARLMSSYLTAWAYVASLAAGALMFLMIVHAMGAAWPVAVRRMAEAIVGILPLAAVLFVPLLFGLDRLYPWLRPEAVHDEHTLRLLHHKRPYLNWTAFLIRTAVYLGVFIAVGGLLRRWSLRSDREPLRDACARQRRLGAGALPIVGLAWVFASFDWLMSLDPMWVSTMFPIYTFAGAFLSAIALITVLTFAGQRAGLLPGITESHYYALGRLLLAFTIFWAYAAYFQLMLIWIANVPEEAQWYVRRWEPPWRGVSIALGLARFAIPFFLLLSYGVKRRPAVLAAISVWILAAHYIDIHWLVMPEAEAARGLPYHWLDAGALLAVLGFSVAFAALRLRGHATLPVNDPALPRALGYESI